MEQTKLFENGTIVYWAKTGKPAFKKCGETGWDWWRSLETDLDKPLEKRYGWRWPDKDVFQDCNRANAIYKVQSPAFCTTDTVGGLVRIWLNNGHHFYLLKEQAHKLKQNIQV